MTPFHDPTETRARSVTATTLVDAAGYYIQKAILDGELPPGRHSRFLSGDDPTASRAVSVSTRWRPASTCKLHGDSSPPDEAERDRAARRPMAANAS